MGVFTTSLDSGLRRNDGCLEARLGRFVVVPSPCRMNNDLFVQGLSAHNPADSTRKKSADYRPSAVRLRSEAQSECTESGLVRARHSGEGGNPARLSRHTGPANPNYLSRSSRLSTVASIPQSSSPVRRGPLDSGLRRNDGGLGAILGGSVMVPSPCRMNTYLIVQELSAHHPADSTCNKSAG